MTHRLQRRAWLNRAESGTPDFARSEILPEKEYLAQGQIRQETKAPSFSIRKLTPAFSEAAIRRHGQPCPTGLPTPEQTADAIPGLSQRQEFHGHRGLWLEFPKCLKGVLHQLFSRSLPFCPDYMPLFWLSHFPPFHPFGRQKPSKDHRDSSL
jgi:hypothetical protein